MPGGARPAGAHRRRARRESGGRAEDVVRLRATLAHLEAAATDAEAYARADLDCAGDRARGPQRPAGRRARRAQALDPGVIALRAHEAIADSSIDKVIDDYRQLVGAIELGDERRSLRALDDVRPLAGARPRARLFPDDDREQAGPRPAGSTMKTAERTRIAFERGTPDRVPIHCWLGLPLIRELKPKNKTMTDMLEWWIDDPMGSIIEVDYDLGVRPDDQAIRRHVRLLGSVVLLVRTPYGSP